MYNKFYTITIVFISLFAIFFFSSQVTAFAYTSQPDQCAQGTGYVGTGTTKDLYCPATFAQFQALILRIFGIVNLVIGLVLLFALIKAGIGMLTAGSDAEKVAKSRKALQNCIFGFIGVGLAYVMIVFIGTLLLGKDITFVDSNKIIFNFLQFTN
jgi:hypothetical protein